MWIAAASPTYVPKEQTFCCDACPLTPYDAYPSSTIIFPMLHRPSLRSRQIRIKNIFDYSSRKKLRLCDCATTPDAHVALQFAHISDFLFIPHDKPSWRTTPSAHYTHISPTLDVDAHVCIIVCADAKIVLYHQPLLQHCRDQTVSLPLPSALSIRFFLLPIRPETQHVRF